MYNTVWINFGLLINDSNSPTVLRPAECGDLLDRSIDWGSNKQRKALGPWALSLPTLWPHHSCAQGTVTSLGSQAVLLPAGTRAGEGPEGSSGASPELLPQRGCTGPRGEQAPRGTGHNPGSGQLCSLPAPLASSGDVGFTVPLLETNVFQPGTLMFQKQYSNFFFLEGRDKL